MIFGMRRIKLFVTCAALAALLACGGEPAAESEPQEYAIHGRIIELKPADQVAIIEHDEIEGWMGAMRMGFPIRDKSEFDALSEGDWIDGTVYVDGFEYSVGEIAVVDPPENADPGNEGQ